MRKRIADYKLLKRDDFSTYFFKNCSGVMDISPSSQDFSKNQGSQTEAKTTLVDPLVDQIKILHRGQGCSAGSELHSDASKELS